ncbi:MAG: YfbM family protein [Chloroflexota bacterium]
MKMIGNLRPASDSEIERLLANPSEITRFLYGADADSRERVVLNKAWHAIHYALTGSRLGGVEPLNFLAAEGTPVGEVDVGFGPARVLTSRQVSHIAAALGPIEPEDVAARVDLSAFDQEAIYPGNWRSNGFGVEYVTTNYREMRSLIQRAAERGQGLVLYIN